jgi:bifunctional non-homologous end joining protein LigD
MNGTLLRFIVQRHKTCHPHYDLRLEVNGVLTSWIIPKGIPEKEDEKRLAIEDKEENTSSISSSNTIIEDGYGIGEVETLDSGFYEIEEKKRGKIIFRAKGEKLSGRFILLLPGWGRWSKKRLWVLIKLGENHV